MRSPALPIVRPLSAHPADRPAVIFTSLDAPPAATGLAALDDTLRRVLALNLLDAAAPVCLTAPAGDGYAPVAVVALPEAHDVPTLRERAAQAIALLRRHRQAACTVVLPGGNALAAQAIVEGVLAANHRYESSGVARDSRRYLDTVAFAGDANDNALARGVRAGWLTSLATLSARDLVTEPANILTPPAFVEHCRAIAAHAGFGLQVMGLPELEAAHMGGLLAVACGSQFGPYLVRMDWRPEGVPADARPIVLVGKTVTFDSGGLSLKKAQDMDFMKADMGGGAAVFGAMAMIAELKPRLPISALFAVVENMPGSHAMRPSDVIRMASGATVEIINTDCEGRLILADALHYATGLAPRVVIDLATLTGATLGTFGPIGTSVFANDDAWFAKLNAADRIAGEKVWRMPLWREYLKFLESPVADSRHYPSTGQNGSTPIVASFLSQFIGDHPWLHLDIYNTCWNHHDTPLMPEGPTGSGTRVLAQLILDLAQEAGASAHP